MDYSKFTKDEVIEQLDQLQSMLDQFIQEKKKDEDLDYTWTGNLGHWYWDLENNIVKFNDLKINTLGYSREELPKNVGHQFFTKKVHPEDYSYIMQNMRDHLEGRTPAYDVEYRIQAKDGTWKWFYDRGKITVRDKNNAPLFLSGIVFDISYRKSTEEQNRRLIKELESEIEQKNKIFSVISHDLISPFSGLLGYGELLEQSLPLGQKTYEYASLINTTLKQSYKLLRMLVNWYKLKSGKQSINNEYWDLNDILNEFIKSNIKIAQQKRIHLSLKNSVSDEIECDENILLTILRNLLNNALRFTPANGKIEIIAEEEGSDDVVISVRDNGTGISKEKLEVLFKESVDSAVGLNKEIGSGIGLTICYDFVKLLNGSIWVESEEGEGSSFFVKIPKVQPKVQE